MPFGQAREEIERAAGQQTAESRLRLALDAARMGTWERDLLTRQDFWSGQEEALFGLAPGTFPATHAAFLDLIHPDDRPAVEDAARRAIEGNGRYESEFRIRKPDGSVRWMAGRGDMIRDASGRATHMVGVTMDVTEHKLAERRLALEHAVARALSEAPSLREAAAGVLGAVGRNSGWQWAALWAPDRRHDVLRCVEVWMDESAGLPEFDRFSRATSFAKGIGLPGRVWAGGQPAWIVDVKLDDNFPRRQAADAAGLHGGFAFPVVARGEVVGVMEFFSHEARPPDEPLLAMMGVVGGQVGQFIDRRRTEQGLKESEARTAAVIESALDCVVLMDHEGKVVEWNPASERTFGYSRGEAVGQEMAGLIIPPALRDAHRVGLPRYLATGEGPVVGKRLEITAMRKDGVEFPVELGVTRIPTDGPPMFTGYLRDISDRKLAQEELKRAKEQAEAASAAKDQFLAVLSHELRTPLTPVLASVEMLGRQENLPEEVALSLETIRRNVQMEARIIDDLLDLTRIARGKVELRTKVVDAHASLRHALEVWQRQVEEKGLEVTLQLSARRHHVRADPARLQQIFWNLIGNAVKFTPEGGRISLRSSNGANDHVSVEVCDTGVGIDAELLPRLFNAFEQGERAVTRRYGGLGLGLSISKALAEMHHGTLTVASEGAGRGAAFTLSLGTSAAPSPEQPARAHAAALPGKPLRILLVEDHEDTLRVLARLLRSSGYGVGTAANVQAALEMAGAEAFDLLVSDLGLPDGSGCDLMRQVKANQPIKGIALSGFGMEEDVQRSREAGFDLHLTKPVTLDALETAIRKLSP